MGMGMGMGTGMARNTHARPDWQLAGLQSPLAVGGAAVCVGLTVALASGMLLGHGLSAVAGALFVLLIVWCLAEPRTDRTLAVFALYIGLLDAYLKLSTGIGEFAIIRDVILWTIAAGALWRAADRGDQLRLPPLGGLVLAFALIVLAGLFNPAAPGLLQGLAGVRGNLEFIPLFFLAYAFLRSKGQLKGLLLILAICASASGIASYVQSTLTPQQFAAWGPGYSDQILGKGQYERAGRTAVDKTGNPVVRPFGLGTDAGAGAVAAVAGLPALLALLLIGTTRARIFLIFLAPGILLGVATSGGRGALIAAVISLGAFLAFAVVSRKALTGIIVVSVTALACYGVYTELVKGRGMSERYKTISPSRVISSYKAERLESLSLAPRYVVEAPLGLGVGSVGSAAFNSVLGKEKAGKGFRSENELPLNSETQWNYLLIETGVIGLAIYLVLIGRILARAATGLRRVSDVELRLSLAALAAPLTALLVLGFSGTTSLLLVWPIAGVFSYWLFGERRPSEVGRAEFPAPSPSSTGLDTDFVRAAG